MSDKEVIVALLREREGYVLTRQQKRVEEVDAELKRLGYGEKEKAAEEELETATVEPSAEKAVTKRRYRRKAKP